MANPTRYELSEGTSNKFWEIRLEDNAFITKHGKIGANGQTLIKKFGSAAEAKKEHDKIVAEKLKKGYSLVGGSAKASAKSDAKSDAKAAPAKTTAKAIIAAAGGARRFEFVEGSSSKFWEVIVEGKSCKTRFGKIGASGQESKKDFGSAADAQKEADKLVTEKTKKGYVEVGGGGGGPTPSKATKGGKGGDAGSGIKRDARNPELEAAIIADPSDRDAYTVYADWLMEQGDPRGELITLQLGYKDKQARQLIEKHIDYFLGPLKEHEEVYDEGGNNSISHLRTSEQEKAWQKTHRQAFLWRNGFIQRVRLSHDEYSVEDFNGKISDILKMVLDHPSARFATEFAFMSNGDPNENNLQNLIDLLGKKAPVTTRRIILGDNVDQISWHHTGNLSKMWPGVPNLRVLEIETGEFDVGTMNAPKLEKAIFITGGLSKKCFKNIVAATMPSIKHLEIYFGDDNYGGNCQIKDVEPFLARKDLKNLEYLGLKNSMFADDIARAIATEDAPILKTLKTLDLSLGTMTDEGAKALADAAGRLKHLECLDLTRNYLTAKGIKLVKGICPKVITNKQEEAEDEDDRYVSIAE
jgi:uncharacterized protein (TIGR02996 family)